MAAFRITHPRFIQQIRHGRGTGPLPDYLQRKVVSAGIEFLIHLEEELPVNEESIPLSATQVSRGLADEESMIQRLRARAQRLHAAAIGVAGCSCGAGAGAHFMAHPCIEHAIVAVLAFSIGALALIKGSSWTNS